MDFFRHQFGNGFWSHDFSSRRTVLSRLPSNDFYGKPAVCSLRFVKAREDASFHSIFIEIYKMLCKTE